MNEQNDTGRQNDVSRIPNKIEQNEHKNKNEKKDEKKMNLKVK